MGGIESGGGGFTGTYTGNSTFTGDMTVTGTLTVQTNIVGEVNTTIQGLVTVDGNDANQFVVQKDGGGTKVLQVDTSANGVVTFQGDQVVVATTSTGQTRGLVSSQHNAGTDGARLRLRKSRGTFASPTTVVTGDNLGRLVGAGHDGTAYLEMGVIQIQATGTIATNRIPTEMSFWTATDAAPSVLTRCMTILPNGNVGIATASPNNTLEVNGAARFLGDIIARGTLGIYKNTGGTLGLAGQDNVFLCCDWNNNSSTAKVIIGQHTFGEPSDANSFAQFDDNATAANTRMLIYDVDNGQLERVSVGAADSGGSGFKVLRIPN